MSDVIVAFDDFVHGAGIFYSSSFLNGLLGELEGYAIEAVAEGMPGVSNGTLSIQLETSGDGRNWSNKNPTAEIGGLSVSAASESTAFGYDVNVRPGAALVRLRLDFSGAGTLGARIVVSVRAAPDPKFCPARTAGCNLWLRADRGVSIVSGAVSSWKDGSVAGHDASQSTSSRQPAYAQSLINGMPTLFFDASSAGSEKILSIIGSLSLSAGNVFLVGKSVNAVPPTSARTGLWRLGAGGSPVAFPFVDGIVYDDLGSNTRYTCGPPVASITTGYCYEVRATSGSWNSYLNGTAQFSNGTNTVAWSGTLELGGNSASGVYYDGHLAEVLLYDHVLQTWERDPLVRYLNARYALSMV